MAEVREAGQTEKLFSWPTPQDYNEAVQSPAFCFNDPDLKTGTTELNEFGLPRPISGGFASVYHVKVGPREFAVRCFLSRVSNLQFRYEAITEHLLQQPAPWTVPCQFIPQGMLVGTSWFPVLKMEWIKGATLGAWVENNLADPRKLINLHANFQRLVLGLKQHGIAHGDLQPANILVMEDGSIKLVDYDGMYVPSLAGARANELGHKNFQHPARSASHFNSELDNFAAWLISTALEILVLDPNLWQQLNCGDDALLFRNADLCDPDHSYTFSVLEAHENEDIVSRARLIRTLARGPLEAVPGIEATVEVDAELPTVEYVPPTQSEDIASYQAVPRPIHRPRSRSKKRTRKAPTGAMAAISAHIAQGLALDNARNRKIILYPTLVLAAVIAVSTFAIRFSAGPQFVTDYLTHLFQPKGVSAFEIAHEHFDRNNYDQAEKGFALVTDYYSDPSYGLKDEEVIEAWVHRAEIAYQNNNFVGARKYFGEADKLSKVLRTKEMGRDEPYDQDYFTQQELLCDLEKDDADTKKIGIQIKTMLENNPNSARWTPWALGGLFKYLLEENSQQAIAFWKAWYAAVLSEGDDFTIQNDMRNLAFEQAHEWAITGKAEDQKVARELYTLMQQIGTERNSRQDQIDATLGLYYLARAEKDSKLAMKISKQLYELDVPITENDLKEYVNDPPSREYRPEQYHSS